MILSPSEGNWSTTMNRAGEHGAKAAVIEGKESETCVSLGCVPKIMVWAQIAESIQKYG